MYKNLPDHFIDELQSLDLKVEDINSGSTTLQNNKGMFYGTASQLRSNTIVAQRNKIPTVASSIRLVSGGMTLTK